MSVMTDGIHTFSASVIELNGALGETRTLDSSDDLAGCNTGYTDANRTSNRVFELHPRNLRSSVVFDCAPLRYEGALPSCAGNSNDPGSAFLDGRAAEVEEDLMVAHVNIPNPHLQAEEQLKLMEAEAESLGESTHFVLASMHWLNVPDKPGFRRKAIGREVYVERQFLGGLRYRRFMDCDWIDTPEWAFAHILREEVLMMLAAYYSEQAVAS